MSFALLKISSLSNISCTAKAAAKELTEGLIKTKSICIAYETVTADNGRLPLLAPMSAVAGIRGYGMMGGIDIKMKDKPGKAGFQTFKHCYDAGVNFKNTGDNIIIAPQFICEKKHIDEIIEKLRSGISSYAKS